MSSRQSINLLDLHFCWRSLRCFSTCMHIILQMLEKGGKRRLGRGLLSLELIAFFESYFF